MADTELFDAGGTLWDWPNQQVVRADQSGPGWEEFPEPDPPTITGTTPAGPWSNAANLDVTVHGTLFGPATMLWYAGFTPAAYAVISPTEIQITQLEIGGLAPGTNDLSVFDPATGASGQPFPVEITAA